MDDTESRTLWVGNLSDKVTEEVLYELFLQVAPLEDVRIPMDRSGRRANYAFIVVKHQVSVNYVVQLLDGTALYERSITIKPRAARKPQEPFIDVKPLANLKQEYHQEFQPGLHNDRRHGKPYRKPEFNKQNWNHNHNHRNDNRNRRRYY